MQYIAAAAAKLLQLCPTPCDPIDGSPPGSPNPWDSPSKNTGVGPGVLFIAFYLKNPYLLRKCNGVTCHTQEAPTKIFSQTTSKF